MNIFIAGALEAMAREATTILLGALAELDAYDRDVSTWEDDGGAAYDGPLLHEWLDA